MEHRSHINANSNVDDFIGKQFWDRKEIRCHHYTVGTLVEVSNIALIKKTEVIVVHTKDLIYSVLHNLMSTKVFIVDKMIDQ